MKEFGKNEYKNVVYVDFFNETEIAKQFDYDLNPERIITMLSAQKREKIARRYSYLYLTKCRSVPAP